MNIVELLKYLSPVALLGIIWSVVQFFQKKKIAEKEARRSEKIEIFRELHRILNELKNKLTEYQFTLNRSNRYLRKNLQKLESNGNSNFEKLEELNLSINDIDNKSHLSQIEKLISKKKKIIELVKNEHKNSNKIFKEELNSIKLKFNGMSESIKSIIPKLNNIPLLGLMTNPTIKSKIYYLSRQLEEVSIMTDTNNDITNLPDEFTETIVKSVEMIFEIEYLINKELK